MPIFGIAFACLGVSILTFSTDSTNNSDRALIIDNCTQEDQDSALSFMSLLSAVGMLSGYILGAINWENTFLKVLGIFNNHAWKNIHFSKLLFVY